MGASSYVFYSKQHLATLSDRAVLTRHRYFATSLVKELRQSTEKLASFPGMGRAGRVHGTRELVIHKNYLAIYLVRADDVEILRIHHVARKR
jgi:plasmid stabilization system protein ParE